MSIIKAYTSAVKKAYVRAVIPGDGGSEDLSWSIPITGQSAGTPTAGTMVITCSEDVTITATGDVTISVVQAADGIYRRHTVTINCPNGGSGTVVIPDNTKVKTLGGLTTTKFYSGTAATMPKLTLELNKIPSSVIIIKGDDPNFTTTGELAMPPNLKELSLYGQIVNGSYTGSFPSTLRSLFIYYTKLQFTISGGFPSGMTYLYIYGDASSTFNISSSSALPTALTSLYLSNNSLNWTGLDIGDAGNITSLELRNFRTSKMSSADMITLLTQLTNRTGTLPATVIINDYADYALPPTAVTDAVAALKIAKSITTVTLGA